MFLEATFWEHFKELRKTLLLCFATILTALVLSFCFYQQIFGILTSPLQENGKISKEELKKVRLTNKSSIETSYTYKNQTYVIAPGNSIEIEESQESPQLVVFGPLEGMMIALKASFWIGIVLSSPIWLFLLLRFVYPALRPNEGRLIFPFISISLLFILMGILFAFFVTIPFANRYLSAFNASIGTNLWSLSHYLDFTLLLVLANGLAFELAVVLLLLVHQGVLSAQFMVEKRRYMIVLAFILGALLTPPDVPTQLLLAIPLIVLYELTLLYARFRHRKHE